MVLSYNDHEVSPGPKIGKYCCHTGEYQAKIHIQNPFNHRGVQLGLKIWNQIVEMEIGANLAPSVIPSFAAGETFW